MQASVLDNSCCDFALIENDVFMRFGIAVFR